MKGGKALVFAVVFGMIAAMASFVYIAQYRKMIMGGYEPQPVVIAKQNILMNTPISAELLDIRMVPKPYVQPQAIKTIDAVEGYIATANIFAGEQILDTKLGRLTERAVSLLIPEAKRAFTISVNEISGVAGLVRPGDRIDIIGVFQTADKKTRLVSRAETVTLFQNIEVLSVGRNYALESLNPLTGSRSPGLAQSQKRANFSNITLLVSPREAMDLALAQSIGELNLVLRSYYDRPGKVYKTLKTKRSTPASVTGIEQPLRLSPVPKWLELRGERSALVP